MKMRKGLLGLDVLEGLGDGGAGVLDAVALVTHDQVGPRVHQHLMHFCPGGGENIINASYFLKFKSS